MSIGRFYGMIGALIRDAGTGKYLMLRRSSEKDVGSGSWECVTGRVDQGEGFSEALQREVMEELGVHVTPDFILRTSHFYRGEPIPENEMVGVMVACSLATPEAIRTSWEHSESCWISVEEAVELLPSGYWLAELIQRDAAMRELIPESLLDFYHQTGI